MEGRIRKPTDQHTRVRTARGMEACRSEPPSQATASINSISKHRCYAPVVLVAPAVSTAVFHRTGPRKPMYPASRAAHQCTGYCQARLCARFSCTCVLLVAPSQQVKHTTPASFDTPASCVRYGIAMAAARNVQGMGERSVIGHACMRRQASTQSAPGHGQPSAFA
jgi:hypothetical protein